MNPMMMGGGSASGTLSSTSIITQLFIFIAVPFVMKIAVAGYMVLKPTIDRLKQRMFKYSYRTITCKVTNRSWINNSQDNKNQILQKAILLYLGNEETNQTGVEYPIADFRLVSVAESSTNGGDEEDESQKKGDNAIKQLKDMQIKTFPPQREWALVANGIYLRHEERADEDSPSWHNKQIITYQLKSPNGQVFIDNFVTKCYEWYVGELEKKKETSRYLYQLQVQKKESSTTKKDDKDGGGDGEGEKEEDKGAQHLFKKYVLSEEKTFQSLFFENKEKLLNLVDSFQGKTGKFAIPGFPYKLGVLLSGPPGTGKTSIVKSLAQYTGRHIVTVPLAKITTNQELYDIMYDLKFPAPGDDGVPDKYAFDRIVFLMEDVDAASDIVKKRVTTTTKLMSTAASHVFEPEGDDAAEDGVKAAAEEALERQNSLQQDILANMAMGPIDPSSATAVTGTGTDSKSLLSKLLEPADKLDLAGLLNVLDGVVDTPGRIVIMTTNHPEKLDPALIRPGRINLQMFLDYITYDNYIAMVQHHFGKQPPETVKKIGKALMDKSTLGFDFTITPAEVEQICSEADTIEEFIDLMVKWGGHGTEFKI